MFSLFACTTVQAHLYYTRFPRDWLGTKVVVSNESNSRLCVEILIYVDPRLLRYGTYLSIMVKGLDADEVWIKVPPRATNVRIQPSSRKKEATPAHFSELLRSCTSSGLYAFLIMNYHNHALSPRVNWSVRQS